MALNVAAALAIICAIQVGNNWGELAGKLSLFLFMILFLTPAFIYNQYLRDKRDGITPEVRRAIDRLTK